MFWTLHIVSETLKKRVTGLGAPHGRAGRGGAGAGRADHVTESASVREALFGECKRADPETTA